MAGLLLIFPASSSTRLWIAASAAQFTLAVTMFGMVAALRGLAATGRKSIAWHGAAVTLYAISLLTYELALAGILIAVLLYRTRAPWRRAATRAVVDVGAALLIVVLFTRKTPFEKQSLGGAIDHAGVIFDQAVDLFGSVVWPFGGTGYLALVPHVALVAASVAVLRASPADAWAQRALRRWLALLASGLVVVAAGYAMFVPAIDYYAPLAQGIGNRMNAAAGIGFVIIVYSELMLLGTLLFRGVPRAPQWTQAFALGILLFVAIGYLDRLGEDKGAFQRAYEQGQRSLATINANVPRLEANATLYSFGHAIEERPGFPIWGNTWDLESALGVLWRQPALLAAPAFPGITWSCDPTGLRATHPAFGSGARFSTYDRTVFVDVTTGAWLRLRDRATCEATTGQWGLNPPTRAP